MTNPYVTYIKNDLFKRRDSTDYVLSVVNGSVSYLRKAEDTTIAAREILDGLKNNLYIPAHSSVADISDRIVKRYNELNEKQKQYETRERAFE